MTTKNEDIRWEQRFANYQKALSQLQKFIDKGDLSGLEMQGLIKAFEYTYELGEMEKNNHPKQSFLFPPHRSTSA